MSSVGGDTGAFSLPDPGDDVERETRHQVLATLLAAYADGEVPAETASQIDAHLLGCVRCRRELEVHRALRLRLEQDSIPAASTALRLRILAGVASATPSDSRASKHGPSALVTTGRGWWFARSQSARITLLVGAVALLAAGAVALRERLVNPVATSRLPFSEVAVRSLPLFGLVLDDYRRVTAHDLPGRSRDLDMVREALPFPVEPLTRKDLRLLAVWTTDLDGEPAAVLAYRWRNQLVLQYIVSEQQLFRPSEVRRAFAGGRLLAARAGAESMLAWPTAAGGALLVGELPIGELAVVRATSESPR